MYIDEIQLTNFRSFKDLTIKLPKDVAVFIGVNGSGKSSVLDAIALLLSQFTKQFVKSKKRSSDNLELTRDDINIDANTSARISLRLKTDGSSPVSWEMSIDRQSNKPQINNRELLKFLKQFSENSLDHLLPVLIYYQAHRFILKAGYQTNSQKVTEENFERSHGYYRAFSNKVNDFKIFSYWLKEEEDLENAIRVREDGTYRNANLEVIRLVIYKFLNQYFNLDFSNLRVCRSGVEVFYGDVWSYKIPFLTIEKDKQGFKLEQLSDGEKNLLMLICEIAIRLTILNPQAKDPRQVLEGTGIILIDEIELHLHPQWQRKVIPSLTATFPNCQFIVTTHSPQVLSQVKKENIFILEDYQVVEQTPHSYGRDSNSILYELMGVEERPIEIKRELDKCFQLIDDNKIDEAKACLKKMTDLLGEDDVEIVRANTLLEFLKNIA